jgi:hypothetical protein
MPFVIRFDDPKRNAMWLRSDYPAIKWGQLADARAEPDQPRSLP